MIFFVVSLPRTGTTSMHRMAEMCGIKSLHVLRRPDGSDYMLKDAIDDGFCFFADTPFYLPEFLCGFLESGRTDLGFIYIHKDREAWERSIKKLYSVWSPRAGFDRKIKTMDHLAKNYILDNKTIDDHYGYIERVASHYGIRKLDYRWGDGWAPFCEFVGSSVPESPVPHLNKTP